MDYPITFFVIRDNMHWMDADWNAEVQNTIGEFKKSVVKVNLSRHIAEFQDGTRILGISKQSYEQGGTRGYANVRYL